jgi:aspartate-semialdehyde dehydrogenase
MKSDIPNKIKELIVRDVNDFEKIPKNVSCVFSAIELSEKEDTRNLEFKYAKADYALISNSSANRFTNDVPMIIPEINPEHTGIIPIQRSNRNLPENGFIAAKPNCSIQSYLVTLYALEKAGFPIKHVQVTTLQAISGAGQAGLTSEEMRENVVPFIGGEEEKTEKEPLKILGKVTENGIQNYNQIEISALCTRVPVVDGHTAVVHVTFKENIPSLEQIKSIWTDFKGIPQHQNLPMAPKRPIIYFEEENRPQPKRDCDLEKGMAVSAGRLADAKFFDIRYVSLSHNTVRGAAGGAILLGELLVNQGYIHGK